MTETSLDPRQGPEPDRVPFDIPLDPGPGVSLSEELLPSHSIEPESPITVPGRFILGNDIKSPQTLTWLDIDKLNPTTAKELARILGIRSGTVTQCQEVDCLPQTFSRKGFLYICIPEFHMSAGDKSHVQRTSIHMLINKNLIITIHGENSEALWHVEGEMERRRTEEDAQRFSSHLAGRIIGSVLNTNHRFLIDYTKEVESVVRKFERGKPSHRDFVSSSRMLRSLRKVQSYLTHLTPVIRALEEPGNLFDAPCPMEALERFVGHAQSLAESSALLKLEIEEARATLDAENEAKRTRSSFYFTILGGVLGPPAVFTGIVETAAAIGSVMPTNWFYSTLAVVSAASIGITKFFAGKAAARNGGQN